MHTRMCSTGGRDNKKPPWAGLSDLTFQSFRVLTQEKRKMITKRHVSRCVTAHGAEVCEKGKIFT